MPCAAVGCLMVVDDNIYTIVVKKVRSKFNEITILITLNHFA